LEPFQIGFGVLYCYIYGVAYFETEKSYFELQENIISIIRTQLKVEIQEFEIQSLRRMGRKGDRPRPISIAFTTLGKKIKVLQNKNNLTNTNMYIKEEFPVNILKIRESLKQQQQKEIENGNTAFIKYDKLIVKKNNKDGHSNKRHLSLSPPQISQKGPETVTSWNQNSKHSTNKKHKSHQNNITSYITRNSDRDA
jgi:hypothetical protein